jgi:hypothetical protein
MAILVESYEKSMTSRREAERLVRDAARSETVPGLRFLGSMFIPDDETAFFLFDGAGVEDVRRVMVAAGITIDRIVEADADTPLRSPKED